MFLPFYYYLNDTSDELNEIFIKIGKALYLATRFESHCKTFNMLIEFKKKNKKEYFSLQNDAQVNSFINKLQKLSLDKNIESLIKTFGFDEDISKIMHNARNERNYIAHDLTLGMENEIEFNVSFYEDINKKIDESISIILKAEFFIILMIAIFTHEELPPMDYIKRNKLWFLS
jgi:hypothetical protein